MILISEQDPCEETTVPIRYKMFWHSIQSWANILSKQNIDNGCKSQMCWNNETMLVLLWSLHMCIWRHHLPNSVTTPAYLSHLTCLSQSPYVPISDTSLAYLSYITCLSQSHHLLNHTFSYLDIRKEFDKPLSHIKTLILSFLFQCPYISIFPHFNNDFNVTNVHDITIKTSRNRKVWWMECPLPGTMSVFCVTDRYASCHHCIKYAKCIQKSFQYDTKSHKLWQAIFHAYHTFSSWKLFKPSRLHWFYCFWKTKQRLSLLYNSLYNFPQISYNTSGLKNSSYYLQSKEYRTCHVHVFDGCSRNLRLELIFDSSGPKNGPQHFD